MAPACQVQRDGPVAAAPCRRLTHSLFALHWLATHAQVLLAAPLGLRAKSSVAARNATLLAGMAALIGADLCFAFVPSWPGDCRSEAACVH